MFGWQIITSGALALMATVHGVEFPGLVVQEHSATASVVASECQSTLTEVKGRLPMDYGTQWTWGTTDGTWAGLYYPGQNRIVLDQALDCGWVPIVATHEWVHQVQDLSGLSDHTMVGAYATLEYVAECAARVIADHEGWPHYDSYPELGGHPCSEFSTEVQEVLSVV